MVLDGGLATWLERSGYDTRGPLWSARALIDAPERIAEAQRAFVRAGAECVATATYQATVEGLIAHGASPVSAERLLAESVDAGRRALSGVSRPVLVAASVGPYGAALADGSEYRGDYSIDSRGLRRFHRRRLELLTGSQPDLVALETIPSAVEAQVFAELVHDLAARGSSVEGAPGAWMSFSLRDESSLADGTPLEASWLESVLGCPQLVAVGVNCVAPGVVAPALDRLRGLTTLPLVAYPNSGEVWEHGAWRGREAGLVGEPAAATVAPTDAWEADVERWWDAGARWLGGCCRIGETEIAATARQVERLRLRDGVEGVEGPG
ncbi:MAG: homocysteine S-methyltransferase [Acidobacteria bacterium]|nr:MAG: homocysteine S-methyltransferase [Acidobacteriota bacterium]REK11369.1 MAG: homocysteine S-methyltransferase [Acidobacteriota bacterium]